MSGIPKGTRIIFHQDQPPPGWHLVQRLPGGGILCEMGDATEPKKCPKCSRKMLKSTLKPGKVYCNWCREYADAA